MGDLDNPIIKVKGAKGESQLMQKTCHKCQEIVPLATRTCPSCKNEFEFKHNLTLIPDQDNLAKINWFSITETKYDIYYNKKNIPILRVNYRCGLRIFREFVCFDHGGYSMFYAKKWWQKNCMNSFIPNDSENALSNVHFLKEIKKILVDESGKYPEIIEFQFKNKAIMYLS